MGVKGLTILADGGADRRAVTDVDGPQKRRERVNADALADGRVAPSGVLVALAGSAQRDAVLQLAAIAEPLGMQARAPAHSPPPLAAHSPPPPSAPRIAHVLALRASS